MSVLGQVQTVSPLGHKKVVFCHSVVRVKAAVVLVLALLTRGGNLSFPFHGPLTRERVNDLLCFQEEQGS